MSRRYIRWVLLIALLITTVAFAADSLTIELNESDWTWEEKQIASFEGTVSGSFPDKILLKLSFSVFPEGKDPGEVVFNTVNGKKLTLRKQQPEYTLASEGLTDFMFIGNWKTPDNVPFTRTEIIFQIWDDSETSLLGEQKLTVTRDASEAVTKDDGKIRLNENFSGWTVWLAVAAAVIWFLAVLRIIINRKKR